MNLFQYIKENEAGRNKGSDYAHEDLIRKIISDPKKIGIENSICSFKEVILRNGLEKIGAVDLIVVAKDNIYVIEGKVVRGNLNRKGKSSLKNIRHELNQQMKKARDFFKKKFDVYVDCIGVYKSSGANKINYYKLESPLEKLIQKPHYSSTDIFENNPGNEYYQ